VGYGKPAAQMLDCRVKHQVRDRVISWAETWAQILVKRALQKFSYDQQTLAMVGAAGIEPATSPV
jgi:hypothetical protein